MLSTRDVEGKLPVHYAIHRNAVLPVVEIMVKASPGCLSVADNHGQLPIHIMESTCDDVKLILIQQSAAEDLMRADKDGQLPLHRALKSHSLSTELLQLLVDRCPSALFHFDRSGQLPLLQAISGSTREGHRLSARIRRLDRVRRLARARAEIIARRAPRAHRFPRADRIPRSMATEGPPELLTVSRLLAERAPETIKIIDPSGKVLLHHLCEYAVPTEVAELIVRLCPDGLGVADLEGRCPLHYAVENDCSTELVQVLLKGFPGAVTLRDKQGRLPLFIACEARLSLDVIFDLIRWSPQLLCELDTSRL
jgi:ankyrin repeat protein